MLSCFLDLKLSFIKTSTVFNLFKSFYDSPPALLVTRANALPLQTTTLIGLLKTARLLRLVRVARKIDRLVIIIIIIIIIMTVVRYSMLSCSYLYLLYIHAFLTYFYRVAQSML